MPGSSSNTSFTISNSFGCSPLTTSFTANNHSNGNPNFHYAWNFGNGNLSANETPPSQTYTTPGSYQVSLATTVDTLSFYLTSVSVNSATGCNDSPFSAPDYYFNLLRGTTTIYSASYIDNTDPPVTFSFSPIKLANVTYTIDVYDYDNGLAGGDDHCGLVNFPGHTPGTFTLNSGSLSVTYTVSHPVIVINALDTIIVHSSPVVPNITYVPNDSLCYGDSIKMYSLVSGAMNFQWYKDTNAILNATDSVYFAKESGIYYIEATNNFGCRTNSNNQKITFIPYPPKPTYWVIGNTINTNLTGYPLQWFFNGDSIPGATGMVYNFTQSGEYYITATNFFGCITYSDTVQLTYVNSISENTQVSGIKVYPNPTKGKFNVELNLNYNSDIKIVVNDFIGRTVYTDQSTSFSGMYNKEIDLTNLGSSIYLVNITVNNEPIHTKLIIQ